MRVTFRLTADIESLEQAAKLRDGLRAHCEAEADCKVSADWSTNEQPFTVVGTRKGEPKKKWWHRLMAENEAEAERKAQEHDKRRVPVVVLSGHVDAGEAVANQGGAS